MENYVRASEKSARKDVPYVSGAARNSKHLASMTSPLKHGSVL